MNGGRFKVNTEVSMDRGYVQVYTGNGKGKTTAALGLAMRAAGAGFKVFIGQFVKGQDYSELHSFARISDRITIRQYGRPDYIYGRPEGEDVVCARDGLAEIKSIVQTGEYKLVILDEANIATYFGLFGVEEIIKIIVDRPPHVELVITGRCVDERIIEYADLITEMREVKHYYNRGIIARVGIES